MKTLKINCIAIICIFLIAFSFSGCEKTIDEAISECDAEENQMEREVRCFNITGTIKWEHGTPATNIKFEYTMHQTYCNGEVPYNATSTGTTDENGRFVFSELFRYHCFDYKNKKDVVSIKFTISDYSTISEFNHETEDYIFPWHFVEDLKEDDLYKTECQITLIPPPG